MIYSAKKCQHIVYFFLVSVAAGVSVASPSSFSKAAIISCFFKACLSPLARLLHLVSSRIGLIGKHLRSGLLSLLLVNMLHEDTLVLESVTLGFQVKFVIQMAINLLGLPVSLQQSP